MRALRPSVACFDRAYLYEAREKARNGEISADDLRAVEDRAILEAIELQKSVGLDVITDGEYRRVGWNPATSFLSGAPIEGYGPADDYRITYMKFWRDDSGERSSTATSAPAP